MLRGVPSCQTSFHMLPKRPAIQRDVAKAAGVTQATVSLALRNSPLIAEATRKKVLQAARRVGYKPDPLLSALTGYRWQDEPRPFRGALAFATNWEKPGAWRKVPHLRMQFEGATQRALELGFVLEEFWIGDASVTLKRASQILVNRGIKGLILAPQPQSNVRMDFKWENFSLVAIGSSLAAPVLHRISPHHFYSSELAFLELLRLGYRRVGHVISMSSDLHVNNAWTGGFLAIRQRLDKNQATEIFGYDVPRWNHIRFERWLNREKPDALLIDYHSRTNIMHSLEKLGIDVPEEIGLAAVNLPDDANDLAGIIENSREVGRYAVDSLASLIHTNEVGIPRFPYHIMVAGQWRASPSIRRVGTPAAKLDMLRQSIPLPSPDGEPPTRRRPR